MCRPTPWWFYPSSTPISRGITQASTVCQACWEVLQDGHADHRLPSWPLERGDQLRRDLIGHGGEVALRGGIDDASDTRTIFGRPRGLDGWLGRSFAFTRWNERAREPARLVHSARGRVANTSVSLVDDDCVDSTSSVFFSPEWSALFTNFNSWVGPGQIFSARERDEQVGQFWSH